MCECESNVTHKIFPIMKYLYMSPYDYIAYYITQTKPHQFT